MNLFDFSIIFIFVNLPEIWVSHVVFGSLFSISLVCLVHTLHCVVISLNNLSTKISECIKDQMVY